MFRDRKKLQTITVIFSILFIIAMVIFTLLPLFNATESSPF